MALIFDYNSLQLACLIVTANCIQVLFDCLTYAVKFNVLRISLAMPTNILWGSRVVIVRRQAGGNTGECCLSRRALYY